MTKKTKNWKKKVNAKKAEREEHQAAYRKAMEEVERDSLAFFEELFGKGAYTQETVALLDELTALAAFSPAAPSSVA